MKAEEQTFSQWCDFSLSPPLPPSLLLLLPLFFSLC